MLMIDHVYDHDGDLVILVYHTSKGVDNKYICRFCKDVNDDNDDEDETSKSLSSLRSSVRPRQNISSSSLILILSKSPCPRFHLFILLFPAFAIDI